MHRPGGNFESAAARRRGFTLTELLVTMLIIAILAAALLTALFQAGEFARRAKTQQLIAKLNDQMMARYESYQTRRLPISPSQGVNQTDLTIKFREIVGKQRLYALRELMRMEMPDRYLDLRGDPASYLKFLVDYTNPQNPRPYRSDLRETYRRRIQASSPGKAVDAIMDIAMRDNQHAECLFLALTAGTDDENLLAVSYSTKDLADTDGDNLMEFIDAWGQPIQWIRWPAGFVSEMQPMFQVLKTSQWGKMFPSQHAVSEDDPDYYLTRDPVQLHDAFDHTQVDRWEPHPDARFGEPERGYNLIPLIVSAGSNGDFGLYFLDKPVSNLGKDGVDAFSDPYMVFKNDAGKDFLQASKKDSSAADNIHNHLITSR